MPKLNLDEVYTNSEPGVALTGRVRTLTADTTLTGRIRVDEGGMFVLNGHALTINGPFEAGLYKCFDRSLGGTVIFARGSVKTFYPQWWGAVADGINDDEPATTEAVRAAELNGGVVELTAGIWYWGRPVTTKHMTDYSLTEPDTEALTIRGAGKDTIITRNVRDVGIYAANFTVGDHTQYALGIYGSSVVVEGLSFRSCRMGIYMGQDPNNESSTLAEMSFNGFNRIRNIWFDGVGTCLMLQPGQGIYYNTFENLHGETSQIGLHFGVAFDPSINGLVPNRNKFYNIRFTRTWVHTLLHNGDTNTFICCDGEGIAVSKSGKLGSRPPAAIMRQVATLVGAHSGAITQINVDAVASGIQRQRLEVNRQLWIEDANGDGEFVKVATTTSDGATVVPVTAVTLARSYPAGTVVYDATPTAVYMDGDQYSYGQQLNHWVSCHYEQCDRDVFYDGYGHGFALNGINVQRKFDIRNGATLENYIGSYASDLKIGLLQGLFGVNGYDSALAPGEYIGAWVRYTDALHAPIRDRGYDLKTFDVLANSDGIASLYTAISGANKADYFSLAGECHLRIKIQLTPEAAWVGTLTPIVITPPLPLDDFHYTSSSESQFRGFMASVRIGSAAAQLVPVTVSLTGNLEITPPAVWRVDQYNFVQLSITYRWDPEA